MDRPALLHSVSVPGALVRFYLVGLALFALQWTRPLFVAMITPSLLLALIFVLSFHRPWNVRTAAWFAFVAVSAFALEWVGVRSDVLFGPYRYGPGLAPLVGGTPLIIGCNWLLLVYCSHALVIPLRTASLRVLAGSLVMVAYDLAAEWAAPAMQMWHFRTGYPPLRNFVVWFAAAMVYHAGFELFRIPTRNPAARFLFLAQTAFFLAVGVIALLTA